jgi:hypothetical protein
MANETENVDRLLQLLAFKRHEQPPPGYFDRLARDIQLELKAGATATPSLSDRLQDRANWFQRLLQSLETRPYLAGVFGVCVCALMLSSLIDSQSLQQPTTSVTIGSLTPTPPMTGSDEALAFDSTSTNLSTSPMASRPVDALFNGGWIKPQRANFNSLPTQ